MTTITHHPDPSSLMSFAAGSLPEPLSAVVACHVAMCPHCRCEMGLLEMLGGMLIERLAASELERPLPAEAIATAGRQDPCTDRATALPGCEVPAPLVSLVGSHLDQIAWKRLGFGIWHYPLPLSRGVKGDLRLFKVAPGSVMPEHGHGGAEMTLLLRGAYSDEFGRFSSGDVSDLDEEVEHQPIADPETGCICLVASTGRARFKSLVARIVQPFTGL